VSVTGNFTSVILPPVPSEQVALKVNGISHEPLKVKALYVAIAHGDDAQALRDAAPGPPEIAHSLPTVAIENPAGQSGWTALFPQAEPPYQRDEVVLVVGVMVPVDADPPLPPFCWHQATMIKPAGTPKGSAPKDPA
jgi:hypothetical protein